MENTTNDKTKIERNLKLTVNGYEYNKATTLDEFMSAYNWVTLSDWEEIFPDLKCAPYVEVILYNNDAMLRHSIWAWFKSTKYQSKDGWSTDYEVTDMPIRISTYVPHPRYIPKSLKAAGEFERWLYKDINNPDNTQLDYVAEIKVDKTINWGINGLNALLLFKQLCDDHEVANPHGRDFILINYNPYIGYWFGNITHEALKRYFYKRG